MRTWWRPFDEIDEDGNLQGLISRAIPTADTCAADEYITGDNTVLVCAEYDDDTWEDSFFARIGESSEVKDEEEECEEILHPQCKIQSLQEVLEEVKDFLDSRGCVTKAKKASSSVVDLVSLNTCTKQTSLLHI